MSKKLGKKKQDKLEADKMMHELFKDSVPLSEKEDKKVSDDWEEFKSNLALNTGIPNKRSWDISYSVKDISKYHTLFLAYGAEYKNLGSTKKVKRFSKKYNYFDYSYYDKLITCGLSKKKRNELYTYQELLEWEPVWEASNAVVDSTRKSIANFIEEALDSQPNSYAKMLENWFIYCALEFYYFGVAVDEHTKTQVDKLLEIANLLNKKKYKEASELYAKYSHYFWD